MKVICKESLIRTKLIIAAIVISASVALALGAWMALRKSGISASPWHLAFLVSISVAVEALVVFKAWMRGAYGEWRVLRSLRKLQGDYCVIRNWMPSGAKGDVDLILLGQHGVLVLEVKNYQAKYVRDGEQWFNVKPNGFRKRIKSPVRQLEANVRAVKEHLAQKGWHGLITGLLGVPPWTGLSGIPDVVDCRHLPKLVTSLPSTSIPVGADLF